MKSSSQLTEEVNDIIERNFDAHLGYQKAAENVVSPRLKKFLLNQSEKREHYAKELKQTMDKVNPKVATESEGTVLGKLHRVWMDVKSTMNQSDEAVLADCLRGEEASREEYKDLLNDVNELPNELVEIIKKQSVEMYNEVHKVKKLEDLA